MNMKDGIYLGTPLNDSVGQRPMWAVYGGVYNEYWPFTKGSPVPENAETDWIFVADLPSRFEEPQTLNAYVLLDDGSTARKGWDQDWVVYAPMAAYPRGFVNLHTSGSVRSPGQTMRWTDIQDRVTRIIWDGERN